MTPERSTGARGGAAAASLVCGEPATEWDGLCAGCARIGDSYLGLGLS